MKITKLGHCCLIIEIKGKKFLTDPGTYTTAQNDLKDVDCVVISHNHTDHLHMESLKTVLQNNPEAKVVTNSTVGSVLEKESVPYIKVADGDVVDFNGVQISGHGRLHAPIFEDYEQTENTSFLFDKKFLYSGDAFFRPDFPVDILAFPIGAPWANISESVNYVLSVKPRIAFAVHDGNLIKKNGIVQRLPGIYLPKNGIEFVGMEEGREYKFDFLE